MYQEPLKPDFPKKPPLASHKFYPHYLSLLTFHFVVSFAHLGRCLQIFPPKPVHIQQTSYSLIDYRRKVIILSDNYRLYLPVGSFVEYILPTHPNARQRSSVRAVNDTR
jgi:hypothetical protein